MHSSLSFLALLAVTEAAKTIVIKAGSGGFVYDPDTVTADIGDTLEFHFTGSIHSAVSGNFSTPCVQSSTGFDSGAVTSSDVFQVMIQSTDPIWFFCGTPSHCQGGMAGVVNPPSTGDTLTAYKNAAQGATTSTSGKVQGGVVAPVGSVVSSSSAPSSSTATGPGSSTAAAPTTALSSGVATTTSPTTGSSPSASPSAGKPNGGNSLAETNGKVVLLSLVLGLGAFVGLMA